MPSAGSDDRNPSRHAYMKSSRRDEQFPPGSCAQQGTAGARRARTRIGVGRSLRRLVVLKRAHAPSAQLHRILDAAAFGMTARLARAPAAGSRWPLRRPRPLAEVAAGWGQVSRRLLLGHLATGEQESSRQHQRALPALRPGRRPRRSAHPVRIPRLHSHPNLACPRPYHHRSLGHAPGAQLLLQPRPPAQSRPQAE
jgi:hypothetical protein